jgi:hypothetical protein
MYYHAILQRDMYSRLNPCSFRPSRDDLCRVGHSVYSTQKVAVPKPVPIGAGMGFVGDMRVTCN